MEKKQRKFVPEEALVKIWARFPLRSIARFRSVCKEWKSLIDSDFFRDLYESLSSSSSSVSWSIMDRRSCTLALEIVGHYGCERWGLTDTLGSWITRYNPETTVRKASVLSCADGLVLLYTETSEGAPEYHVGNPLLQQWVRIPLPPGITGYDVARLQPNKWFSETGLVTKMEKGIVVGYKVVWRFPQGFMGMFMVYSSETGLWERQNVRPTMVVFTVFSVPLNGILHWLASINQGRDVNAVVSYDFYNGGDECLLIPFPGLNEPHRFRRTITTSAGSVVYCNVFIYTIKVWKLVNYCTGDDPKAWELLWELNTELSLVGFGTDYFPVVMHPLNPEIIYLWSRNKNGLVLLNLRTHEFSLHKEEEYEENKSTDGCIMKLRGCKKYLDSIYIYYLNGGGGHELFFSQYVLPRWLNPLPRLSS